MTSLLCQLKQGLASLNYHQRPSSHKMKWNQNEKVEILINYKKYGLAPTMYLKVQLGNEEKIQSK